jgi:hypothetical protein
LTLCYETRKGIEVKKRFWVTNWLIFVTNNKLNNKLVLVLHVCHAGAAIDELRKWYNDNHEVLAKARCSVRLYSSCSCYELAHGGYYLQTWLCVHQQLRIKNQAGCAAVATSPVNANSTNTLEQNPQYYSSDSNLTGYPEVLTGADLFCSWYELFGTDNSTESLSIERFYRSPADAQLTLLKRRSTT